MPDPIAIVGANSAAGRALVAYADSAAVPVVACVRSERAARELPDPHSGLRLAQIDYSHPASLARAFEGARSVVHLPGILIERPGSSYAQANVETTAAMLAGARSADVAKVVLVSAVGADPASPNRYYATKGRAEVLVRERGIPYTIVRAPLVLGAGTEGESALLRQLASARPRLLGGGRVIQQPLDVADLARGLLRAADPGVAPNATLDLVGPESLAYREIVERAARLCGRPLRPGRLPVPIALLRLLLRVRERIAGPGFSADALDVILDDHALCPKPAVEALGLELTPLEETLRSMIERASDR